MTTWHEYVQQHNLAPEWPYPIRYGSERRMEADPNTFFITDHYQNYPMMIVRLSAIDTQDLSELLDAAREHAGG